MRALHWPEIGRSDDKVKHCDIPEILGYTTAKAVIWVLVCVQFCYALSLHLCKFCLDVIIKVCVAKILEFSCVYFVM